MFCGPKLKIDRAKRHIADLDVEVRTYKSRNPYGFVFQPNTQSDPTSIDVIFKANEGSPDIPKEFALFIGDAIHNLRAALDLLACELVRLNGKSDKRVYFPFVEKRNYFETMIKERNIDRAAPDIVDIFRSLKPYHGGNDALRAIHDLDMADKHRLLLPVAYFLDIDNLRSPLAGDNTAYFPGGKPRPLKDGAVCAILPGPESGSFTVGWLGPPGPIDSDRLRQMGGWNVPDGFGTPTEGDSTSNSNAKVGANDLSSNARSVAWFFSWVKTLWQWMLSRRSQRMDWTTLDVPDIKNEFHFRIEIAFDEGQPFEGEAVVPTLHQLAQLVDGIVETFETHFKRSDP